MKHYRLVILLIILVCGALLAPYGYRFVEAILIEPIAYCLWGLEQVFRVIPQSIYWIVIIISQMMIVYYLIIRSLFKREKAIGVTEKNKGSVEKLAEYIHQSDNSDYFKWVIANHLANLRLQMVNQENGFTDNDSRNNLGNNQDLPPDILQYFNAGLNQSFMAYRKKRKLFVKPVETPFELDLDDIIKYLESSMESE
jgi:hypothetical protein